MYWATDMLVGRSKCGLKDGVNEKNSRTISDLTYPLVSENLFKF